MRSVQVNRLACKHVDGRLLWKQVIKTDHDQGICVRQDSLVYRKLEPGLVDSLKYCNRMSSDFTYDPLKCERGAVEQFQCPSNSLQEMHLIPFGSLIRRPSDSPDLGHGREAIV